MTELHIEMQQQNSLRRLHRTEHFLKYIAVIRFPFLSRGLLHCWVADKVQQNESHGGEELWYAACLDFIEKCQAVRELIMPLRPQRKISLREMHCVIFLQSFIDLIYALWVFCLRLLSFGLLPIGFCLHQIECAAVSADGYAVPLRLILWPKIEDIHLVRTRKEARHRFILIQLIFLEIIFGEGGNPLHLLADLRGTFLC